MADLKLKGNSIHTVADLPKVGSAAPSLKLTKSDLSDVSLENYKGKKKILNVFPSIDTPVCATSVRKFNEKASSLPNAVVLCISADLPFAQKRFCGAEGIANVETLSDFRNESFGKSYGLELADGPMAGLLARAVLVLDENDKVLYTELVDDIIHEPNYDAALSSLG
ncbi:MAG: thiol peroxidase [Leptospira sp.]|jgi:thioredoxin-dependent peroxiredoxin|nr:thiol peroxidase [Leptospira sp.]